MDAISSSAFAIAMSARVVEELQELGRREEIVEAAAGGWPWQIVVWPQPLVTLVSAKIG